MKDIISIMLLIIIPGVRFYLGCKEGEVKSREETCDMYPDTTYHSKKDDAFTFYLLLIFEKCFVWLLFAVGIIFTFNAEFFEPFYKLFK